MNSKLHLRIMIAALRKSGARGIMAMISVGLAVGAIMIALALSRGAGGELQTISDEMGKNLFVVKAGQIQSVPGRVQGWSTSTRLRAEDVDMLRATIADIAVIVPISEASLKVRFGRLDHSTSIRGVLPEYLVLRNLQLASGRFVNAADEAAASRVAVIGSFVARKLNNGRDMLGSEIRIAGIPFEVVGQLSERGLGGTGGNEDDQVLIPTSTALRRVFNVDFFNSLLVQVGDRERLDAVRSQTRELLRESHRIDGNSKDDFEILSLVKSEEIRKRNGQFLRGISQIFALITLLIGGTGVFAVTFLNVKDRTSEIGLRMALGAKRRNIAGLFIAEACLLSLLGGIVGLLLGWIGVNLLKWFTDWNMTLDLMDMLGPFGVSALLGLMTGVLPALKASRMMPVDALRSA